MCADHNDMASAVEELDRQVALANRSRPNMPFTGRCYWCNEKICRGNFCDRGCCEDFLRRRYANSQRVH